MGQIDMDDPLADERGDSTRPPYSVVTGQGRSGTSWLLSLFDFSSTTFCRNEPYRIAGSPLESAASHRRVARRDEGEIGEIWDAAMAQTTHVMGERDLRIEVPKSYLHPLSMRLGLHRWIRKPQFRSAVSILHPSLSRREWPIPWWLGSEARLETALPVVKLVAAPGWVSLILRHRPDVPVFHVIRHPGGFLNSWRNRYLDKNDPASVREANRERLEEVAASDTTWANRFGDIGPMSVEESELWYWRYANEVVYEAGKTSDNYHRLVYEELVSHPIESMRHSYMAAGLQWDAQVERAIRASSSQSASIASAWREQLSPEHRELVDRVLEPDAEFYPGDVMT